MKVSISQLMRNGVAHDIPADVRPMAEALDRLAAAERAAADPGFEGRVFSALGGPTLRVGSSISAPPDAGSRRVADHRPRRVRSEAWSGAPARLAAAVALAAALAAAMLASRVPSRSATDAAIAAGLSVSDLERDIDFLVTPAAGSYSPGLKNVAEQIDLIYAAAVTIDSSLPGWSSDAAVELPAEAGGAL